MNSFRHDSDSDDSSDDEYEMSGERCEDKDNSEGGSSGRYYNAMEECRTHHASSSSSLSSRLFPSADDNENEATISEKCESCRMDDDISFRSLIEPNDCLLDILHESSTPTNTTIPGITRPRSSSSLSSNGNPFLPKLRELTIIDAIMGFREDHEQSSRIITRRATPSSPEEIINVEAIRKAAYDEYIGVPVQVVVRRKTDIQQCLFKNNTRLMQTIKAHEGAIHTLKFSTDGKFLATGGTDAQVLIWGLGYPPPGSHPNSRNRQMSVGVYADVEDNEDDEEEEYDDDDDDEQTDPDNINHNNDNSNNNTSNNTHKRSPCTLRVRKVPFLFPKPLRVLLGHKLAITDVSWSKSNFLLSASEDKHVMLWHVTREDCLHIFPHNGIVTAVDFHPVHERTFISGCCDGCLRVWDVVPQPKIKEWLVVKEATITSVSYAHNGHGVAVGLVNGKVNFYKNEVEGLKNEGIQLICRNRRGKHKKGRRVTGLCFLPRSADGRQILYSRPPMLVTTNDNRLRLCSVDDYSQTMKYKGGMHTKNRNSHTKASFSDNGKHIICGSEQGSIIIWDKDVLHAHPTSCLPLLSMRKGTSNSSVNRVSSGTRSRTKSTQKNHAYEMITMREEKRSLSNNNNNNNNDNNNHSNKNIDTTTTATAPIRTSATTQSRKGSNNKSMTMRSTGRAIVAAFRGKGLGQGHKPEEQGDDTGGLETSKSVRKKGILDRMTKWLLPDDRTGLQPPNEAATTGALFAPATSIIHSAQSVRLRELFDNTGNNNSNGGLTAASDPYHHDRSKNHQYDITTSQQPQSLRSSSMSLDVNHQSNHQSNHRSNLPHDNINHLEKENPSTSNDTTNFLSAVSSDDSWDETQRHSLDRNSLHHPLHHHTQATNDRLDYNAMLAEFSSRVIVASDAAGYLRVYVRSGGFDRTSNSRSNTHHVVGRSRDHGASVDDFETSL